MLQTKVKLFKGTNSRDLERDINIFCRCKIIKDIKYQVRLLHDVAGAEYSAMIIYEGEE